MKSSVRRCGSWPFVYNSGNAGLFYTTTELNVGWCFPDGCISGVISILCRHQYNTSDASCQLAVCVRAFWLQFTTNVSCRTNVCFSQSETFPMWSVFSVTALQEINSCLKSFHLQWLYFQTLDLRRSSWWFDGALAVVEPRSGLGFCLPQPIGTDMKVISGCFIQWAALALPLRLAHWFPTLNQLLVGCSEPQHPQTNFCKTKAACAWSDWQFAMHKTMALMAKNSVLF